MQVLTVSELSPVRLQSIASVMQDSISFAHPDIQAMYRPVLGAE